MKNSLKITCFAAIVFSLLAFAPGASASLHAQAETEQQSQKDQSVQESDDKSKQDEKSDDKNKDSASDAKKDGKKSPRRNRSSKRNEDFSKNSKSFVQLFDGVTASVTSSTVRISNGEENIALGAVVDPDGFILTKASELQGELECELSDGSKLKAKVFGVDPETDLALLKVSAKDLPSVNWSAEPTPGIGHWLATPDGKGSSLGVGIVSVGVRTIPPGGGYLGILPAPAPSGFGVRISQVTSGKPADKAGVLVNDTIIKIDDEEISNVLKLRETLRNYAEGDLINLTVKRGEKELVLPLRLSDSRKENPMFDRSNTQNSMGSTLSRRRLDFPLAFQHDSQLQANDCGGPIVDLSGQVIGINIARAGRVKTLALPANVVVPVIEQLKSGEFGPEVVNKLRISEVDNELKKMKSRAITLPKKKKTLESKVAADTARQEELQRLIDEMQTRLKSLEKNSKKNEEELKKIGKELRGFEANKKQLEEERKSLMTGKR